MEGGRGVAPSRYPGHDVVLALRRLGWDVAALGPTGVRRRRMRNLLRDARLVRRRWDAVLVQRPGGRREEAWLLRAAWRRATVVAIEVDERATQHAYGEGLARADVAFVGSENLRRGLAGRVPRVELLPTALEVAGGLFDHALAARRLDEVLRELLDAPAARRLRVVSPHCGVRAGSTLGGEVFERMLLTRLPARGIELELGLPASRAAERSDGWHVRALHPGRGLRWWVAPLAFVPYTTARLREGADVLRGHSVLFTGPSLLAARRLARRRVPVVLQHHHLESPAIGLQRWLLRRADAVVVGSERSRSEAFEAGVRPDRVHVIQHGVRAPERVEPHPDAWPQGAGLRLLVLGRLERRKRPDLALRALALLAALGRQDTLLVAGSGPLAPSLRRLAVELGIAERIAWVVAPDDDEKWRLLTAADVLLFPSVHEGFGLVPAEAQAVGTPVVAVSGTSVEEVVAHGESGLLVRPTPEAFADAVERLADDGERAAFGRGALEVARRFDWEVAADRHAALLREVAGRY